MIRFPRLLAAATVFALSSADAQRRAPVDRATLDGFDRYVTQAMAQWRVPGLSVAVVRGDSIVLAKGYGVRTLGDPSPVDPTTLFAIGSASKAFTGAALGMLADEGKLSFDRPVTDYLPWFEMADPWMTREMTVRDLLLHRSGVARGDALFYATTLTREEITRAIRQLPRTASFRSRFEYHNLMYIAAGEVVHSVGGQSWDAFMRSRIFGPLGMTHSNTSVRELVGAANVASPHAELNGAVKPVPWRNIDNAAASGSINSNALDMSRWLRLWINQGTFAEKRLLSEARYREAIAPQFTVDDPDMIARLLSPSFLAYGFGWFAQDFRGRRWVQHGGHIDGMSALVGFLPDERIGVVILTNMNQADIGVPLTAHLFDRLLGLTPSPDYNAEYLAAAKAYDAERARRGGKRRVEGTRPSLALSAYAGSYRHPFLGTATVATEPQGHLSIRYDASPTSIGDLAHWHYDSFVATMRDPMMGKVPVTFELGADVKVASLPFGIGGDLRWIKN